MIALLAFLTIPALAATAEGTTLADARAAFARADRDGSGGLDAAEALAAGFPVYQVRGFDADADGRLDRDEYLVARRMRAASQKERVAADLEAEVVRLLARRKARAAELRRLRSAVRVSAGGAGPAAQRLGARTGLRRAARARDQALGEVGGKPAGKVTGKVAGECVRQVQRSAAGQRPPKREPEKTGDAAKGGGAKGGGEPAPPAPKKDAP